MFIIIICVDDWFHKIVNILFLFLGVRTERTSPRTNKRAIQA